ncbi:MAG: DUF1616 domain-containing protein [Chloroflexi bacterium]|nr:DUF1616 domain-containing protein [Chloroflexota bacterium]
MTHNSMPRHSFMDIWGLVALLLLSLAIKSIAIALPAFFFAPGYFTLALVYPEAQKLPLGARLAASIGLSPLIVGVAALAHSYLFAAVLPQTASAIAITLMIAIAAVWRRRASQPTARQVHLIESDLSPWTFIRASLVGAVILALILAVWTSERQTPQYTEFYLLGANGRASGYPEEIRLGEPLLLTIGVVNHEGGARGYSVVALQGEDAVGVLMPFEVADEERRELALSIDMLPESGTQRVEIWLGGDGFEFPYRRLTIWLNVIEE